MTQLRQRMTDDMTVRGLAENTKKSYLNSVAGLARHYRRRPDRISAPEVQDYLLHLHEQKGLTWQSCNCAGPDIAAMGTVEVIAGAGHIARSATTAAK